MKYVFALALIFLAACTQVPSNDFLENPLFCNTDGDCTCGGIDTKTDDCFIGNKLYSSKYVDTSTPCPDFCSGFAGNLETKCVNNKCKSVSRMIACTEEAKLCPDGTAVVRVGPDCEFQPCPGEECSTAADCVPDSCCHASSCVAKDQAPNCEGVMCTMECQPGTLDCGGSCGCVDGDCVGRYYDEPIAPVEEETEESCMAKGGSWEQRFVGFICNFPASDAGKPCTDGDQCEGMCLTDGTKGQCSEMQIVYGCISPLEDGQVTPMCID